MQILQNWLAIVDIITCSNFGIEKMRGLDFTRVQALVILTEAIPSRQVALPRNYDLVSVATSESYTSQAVWLTIKRHKTGLFEQWPQIMRQVSVTSGELEDSTARLSRRQRNPSPFRRPDGDENIDLSRWRNARHRELHPVTWCQTAAAEASISCCTAGRRVSGSRAEGIASRSARARSSQSVSAAGRAGGTHGCRNEWQPRKVKSFGGQWWSGRFRRPVVWPGQAGSSTLADVSEQRRRWIATMRRVSSRHND